MSSTGDAGDAGAVARAPASLDDVLSALQKTLSRANIAGGGETANREGRALMTGNVAYEITLNVVPDGDSRLLIDRAGQPLRLNGQLRTEEKVVMVGEKAPKRSRKG